MHTFFFVSRYYNQFINHLFRVEICFSLISILFARAVFIICYASFVPVLG
jgi:hypothetical protein